MTPNLNTLISIPSGINQALNGTPNSLARTLLGNPRSTYGQDCRPVQHPGLKARMQTRDVGPFRVTGFDLAVQSLTRIMGEIKAEQPRVYDALGTAGMLCCRRVRGSATAISNHAWGCAVDLKINGVLDSRGNGRVQTGLALVHRIFNRNGWFWGAGFTTEDAMHFEVSRELLLSWSREGRLVTSGVSSPSADTSAYRLGDRDPGVARLQAMLNAAGEELDIDGIFGPDTFAAVEAFQAGQGLAVTGAVDRAVWQALGASKNVGELQVDDEGLLNGLPLSNEANERWQDFYGGLTIGTFNIPRFGLANGTLRRELGVVKEPFGDVVEFEGLKFVSGKCSQFGGLSDAVNRGQRMTLTGLMNSDYSEFEFFCAMRWSYDGQKSFWRNRPILVLNAATGKAAICAAVDWGPGFAYRGRAFERVIDLSRGAMQHLGVTTDDNVLVAFVDEQAWIGRTGGVLGPIMERNVRLQHGTPR